MNKIFATTTNEHTQKVQGSHTSLSIAATVGENQTSVVEITIECEETDTENIYRVWHYDILMDAISESKNKEYPHTKYCDGCGERTFDANGWEDGLCDTCWEKQNTQKTNKKMTNQQIRPALATTKKDG